MSNKKDLSERDICTQFILPALVKSGWDVEKQVREEVFFTDGRIFVKGKKTVRGKRKRADFILYLKPNIPLAVIEAKDNNHSVGAGLQQALEYAEMLDVPVAFSSNGDGFVQHDRSGFSAQIETELSLDAFPSSAELWKLYKKYKRIETPEQEEIASFNYFFDGSGRAPRYYQQRAINRTVEAVARGQNRILLVMATGTGKTYTAFQIIYRLWKNGRKKRILFLADRNVLIDQTRRNDFKHFKDRMTVIKKKKIDKAFEIYLALYQGLTNYNEDKDAYKEFSRDFFDLVVVDECHRGSAAADSAWRAILDYFRSATHIGLTATPRETREISNIAYFGEPVYTYTLRQGIEDGFLAPYKVIRVGFNVDLEGWRPEAGKTDKDGIEVDDRIYNTRDFDKNLVIDERTKLVAKKVSEYLRKTNRYDKTIVFCVDIEHAERMRQAIANENPDLALENGK
ncbi:MAG: DEAD/DEAH box helicase family protein [Candidatus Brocadia sp.]|uniref:Deoxyribonuclease n=1 Tax=Candidatus Brocadia fulgida TaxID=380242 RepID=A0A0M2USD8_9BACT|nr:MAG: deoxyribonuclease [Candidatus Brocadia fulgida]UJS21140.1 MAG: DEAD/DEAH box helicase family protein [Candidatus Brocadia sp.]